MVAVRLWGREFEGGKAKDFLTNMIPKGYMPKINVSLTDDYPWAKAIVIIEGIS